MEYKSEGNKIVVYSYEEAVNALLIDEEVVYPTLQLTTAYFDNWYAGEDYTFNRWFGEDNWYIDEPDETTKILMVNNEPRSLIKLVSIYQGD